MSEEKKEEEIKYEVATFADLNYDIETAEKADKFKVLINKQPPESWVKKNPFANNSKYLPIDKTELMLDKIFQQWKIEVLREGVMFNSVYVTVRVHYLHPVLNEWFFHDGVGAKDMQKNSGSSSLNIETIKDAAVMMALPTAKSFAIKDACDHLGILFGRNLNRKDTIDFKPTYDTGNKKPEDKSEDRIMQLINAAKSRKDLEKIKANLSSVESKKRFDERWAELK